MLCFVVLYPLWHFHLCFYLYYFQASNSSSYIQDAFQLLLPVLQTLAIESSMEETQPEQETAPASWNLD